VVGTQAKGDFGHARPVLAGQQQRIDTGLAQLLVQA
jgi:hypothetical protein